MPEAKAGEFKETKKRSAGESVGDGGAGSKNINLKTEEEDWSAQSNSLMLSDP